MRTLRFCDMISKAHGIQSVLVLDKFVIEDIQLLEVLTIKHKKSGANEFCEHTTKNN